MKRKKKLTIDKVTGVSSVFKGETKRKNSANKTKRVKPIVAYAIKHNGNSVYTLGGIVRWWVEKRKEEQLEIYKSKYDAKSMMKVWKKNCGGKFWVIKVKITPIYDRK